MFLFSGILKLFSIEKFVQNVLSFQIIYDKNIVLITVLFLIFIEISVGLSILFNYFPRIGLKISFTLLILFTLFIVYGMLTKQNWMCGCFGSIFDAKIDYLLFLRNTILLLVNGVLLKYKSNLFAYDQFNIKKKRMLFICICIVLLSASIYVSLIKKDKISMPVGINIVISDFMDINNNYNIIKISSLSKKMKIVFIFTLSDCPTCLDEGTYWELLYEKYNKYCDIIGIGTALNENEIKEYIKNKSIKFPVYNDSRRIYKNMLNINTPVKLITNNNWEIISVDGPTLSDNSKKKYISKIDKYLSEKMQ